MTESIHYTVEGQLMKMREMRQIVAGVLEYGDAAYHISVQDKFDCCNKMVVRQKHFAQPFKGGHNGS